MSGIRLDWAAIRPLSGSRHAGFEELIAQLARPEIPAGAKFERKGTPDAGVECYAVLPNGDEWGWQAKYFRSAIGQDQWGELDESVRTVLEKHPRLIRYYVCVPRDRSDGRVERVAGTKKGTKPSTGKTRLVSEKDQWNAHVKKWGEWASDRGMAVEFVFWGSHELIDFLSQPRHLGRLRFWFDIHGFDAQWFAARLDEALHAAGPRYTPEIHVGLPVAAEFEALGRTESFFNGIKARARGVRERLRSFDNRERGQSDAGRSLAPLVAKVSASCEQALLALGEVACVPIGPLPFADIAGRIDAAMKAADELGDALSKLELAHDEKDRAKEKADEEMLGKEASPPTPYRYQRNPFRDRRNTLFSLESQLQELLSALRRANEIAGGRVLLLEGDAGTGKTHLLCDVARQRTKEGRPTVLLMGQLFLTNDDPWTQALRHLDLGSLKMEEFVGALEAAAQAAGCRALVLVDALNEGAGRHFWPNHLAPFLTRLERSPWIAVALSVRSSYGELVVPEEVRSRAARVVHHGFAEHEYDATRTFFAHYKLELPSVPFLAPEFRNPLFLKTLCRGLHERGETRIPRGFHGITATFDLLLGATNARLAREIGFDHRKALVAKALDAFAQAIVGTGKRWIPLAQAEALVNGFLPGRDFDRSLYHGLVSEGLLVEQAWHRDGSGREDIAYVAYERFADHLAAKAILDNGFDPATPASAFAPGGPLAFLGDPHRHVSTGLIEALCVQLPERSGQELPVAAPALKERWGTGDAFRRSVVWRSMDAFSGATRDCLDGLIRTVHDDDDTLDTLLTVAVIPGHPFNAEFLDSRLRCHSMADRDTWWSTYLYRAWGSQGALDRLIDWGSAVAPSDVIEEEAVDLCAVALGWMLTTSHRFVRDRATKALVALLSGRLPAAERFVCRFADVDDPYLTERVYAVAYGVSMRSHDAALVGALAMCVYRQVFASGSPPTHVLLRDYARGVIERALALGATIAVDAGRVRPPYASIWPDIPSEEGIKPYLPDWSHGSQDGGDVDWARNRIGSSVMEDDFARYVIGTNSSATNWLSVPLISPPWSPPPTTRELRSAFAAALSDGENTAWVAYESADRAHDDALGGFVARWFAGLPEKGAAEGARPTTDRDALLAELSEASSPHLRPLEAARDAAFAALREALTEEHSRQLDAILEAGDPERPAMRAPRFDLKIVQRYVLWRVFDLGWTTERFGDFDRLHVRGDGRESHKAERIGKKYQWIAYHEIMALVADHFQYLERYREAEGDRAYEGPWQDGPRDIDPSCTLRDKPGGTSWDGHVPAWWCKPKLDSWSSPAGREAWVKGYADLPDVRDILMVQNPDDNAVWLNADGYFNWKQPTPPDRESSEVERGELWYIASGYLVREEDADAFLAWAEGVDFWGHWMPKSPEVYQMYLGEHSWSMASRYFRRPYYGDGGWTQPDRGCPVKVRNATFEYLCERGFDCSIDDGYRLNLPAHDIVEGMGLRWNGTAADFNGADGRLAAYDPTAHSEGPTALLLRLDTLEQFLKREKLTICWSLIGEKRILAPMDSSTYHGALRMTGAYALRAGKLRGFVKYVFDKPPNQEEPREEQIAVVRTGE